MKPYYERDGITLYHGDCREILPTLGRFDAVVTDPPYAISVDGSAHHFPAGGGVRRLDFFKGDTDWPVMRMLIKDAIGKALDNLTPTGSFYAWVGHRCVGDIVDLLESRGFNSRFLIWQKLCPVPPPPGSGWPSGAEICIYGYPANRTWTEFGRSAKSNVFVADSFRHGQPGKVGHPTQKPFAVITPLILASTNVGDLIVDPFAGSGTTLLAARASDRKAIGIEIEERYCALAAERLSQKVIQWDEPTRSKVATSAQQKNSSALLSGETAVKQHTPSKEHSARNLSGIGVPASSDQSSPRGGANHHG